jgi:hypothetical protein
MRFALAEKMLVFFAALVSALPLALSGEISVAFQVTLLLAWFTAWFIPASFAADPMYRKAVTVFVIIALVVQVARVVKGAPFAMGAMELIVILLAAKFVSRAFASDDYQIALLSFLHIIAAAQATDELLFGVCFVAFAAALPPALAMIHLRREMEQRFGPGSKVKDAKEGLERLFRSKRVVTPGFVLGASLLSVPILVITAVLFVLFPRMSIGLFGRIHSETTQVGFGDTVELRDDDVKSLSDKVLLRLEPAASSRSDAPSRLSIKIRAAVMDTFDGKTWTRKSQEEWRPIPTAEENYVLSRNHTTIQTEYDVLQESMKPKLLCLPEGSGLIAPEPLSDGRGGIRLRRLVMDATGEIKYEDETEGGIRFRTAITGADPPGRPPMHGDPYLDLPQSNRIVESARALAGSGLDREKAERLVFRLKSEYRYSLNLAEDARNQLEETSLERFLFSRKTGTCEHFATALTLMLRAVGIPARLVTGFMGADLNVVGRFYSVREKNAHAWTEAFIDGRWTTLDAVPTGDGSSAKPPSFFTMLLETVEMGWKKHVISYDLGTQGRLALGILHRLRHLKSGSKNAFRVEKQSLLVVGIIALIAIISIFIFRFRSRLFTPRHRLQALSLTHHRHADEIVAALDRRFRQLGRPRPLHLTLNEHLQSIRTGAPFALDTAVLVADRYNEVRFGRRSLSQGEHKRLLQSIREIGRTTDRRERGDARK